VIVGLDRLLQDPQAWLRGRPCGLVANSASRNAAGLPADEALGRALPGGQLRALFAPEHGPRAAAAAGDVIHDQERALGGASLRCYSLYRPDRRDPDPDALAGLSVLLFDLQDVGTRYYTYFATMLLCLRAAARHGLTLMILDRPNPLGGAIVDGPGVSADHLSFVGPMDVPARHGLTLGELARVAAAREGLAPEALLVVPALGWQRSMTWQETGLVWYPPSPNARTPHMTALYPATALVEGTNLSEGRGTMAPFEVAGAPWLDADRLARALSSGPPSMPWRAAGWPAVAPASFVPEQGKWAGRRCHGVRMTAPPRGASVAFGWRLLQAAREQAPGEFEWTPSEDPYGPQGTGGAPRLHVDLLAGGEWLRRAVETSSEPDERQWREHEAAFRGEVAQHLLYEMGGEPAAASRSAGRAAAGARGASRCAGTDASVPSIACPRAGRLELDRATGGEVAAAIIASADRAVAAVGRAQDALGRAIDAIAQRLGATGGRLIYVGAGTSGRLGLLDASECEPTFGVPAGRVLGVMAGGPEAMSQPKEGVEDDPAAAAAAIAALGVGPADAVVGIAASGSTPYTVAAVRAAGQRGALTVGVACVDDSPLAAAATMPVVVPTGPEPLLGSTRLGAGTAQKVICNAISTGVFSRLGYVYKDQMVGVQPANAKLLRRAEGIVAELAGVGPADAAAALAAAMLIDRRLAVRIAALSLTASIPPAESASLLAQARGSLRAAMELAAAKPQNGQPRVHEVEAWS
jgi:N-acetylmuramic acid 6-phosphate etherase